MKKVKWGILGPGAIAHKFARGLEVIPEAELIAVGSRSYERAEAFADEFNVEKKYGSYEQLVKDSEIDVIYVATPHPFHKEHSILCMEAGKAVLCEKPFAINAREVDEMINCSLENKVFLMEAMWTRFLPVMNKVREWIADGKIGKVQVVNADFGFRTELNPEARLFNPELGGGALLDVGIYTLSFASMIFGKNPIKVEAISQFGETNVDEQSAILLGYDQGELALLFCAVRTNTPQEARIIGTKGSIHIPSFWNASSATLITSDLKREYVEVPLRASGYNYEAEEVMNCLQEGRLESDLMPLNETLNLMKTMDRIREQAQLKYPME